MTQPLKILARLAGGAALAFALSTQAAPLAPDPTFGTQGVTFTNIARDPSFDQAAAMLVQPDLKLVVAASCGYPFGNTLHFCVTRYSFNGFVDSSFGTAGVAKVRFPGYIATARAMAFDGTKILVAGTCVQGTATEFCMARLNADGSPDTTFNGTGRVITPVGDAIDEVGAVTIDGARPVVAGSCEVPGSKAICLVRYLGNGTLDTSFGDGGKVLYAPAGFRSINVAGAAMVGAQVVVGGTCSEGSIGNACFARFTTTGAPDATLNGNGRVVISQVSTVYDLRAMAIDGSSRVSLAGTCQPFGGGANRMCLVRMQANGTLDTNLGGTGFASMGPGGSFDVATTMAIDGSNTYLAGNCTVGGSPRFCIAAFTEFGANVAGFNGGQPYTDPILSGDVGVAAAVITNGGIVVAGTCNGSTLLAGDLCTARYGLGGARDVLFGNAGILVQDLRQLDGFDYVDGLTRQPDGKILASGTCGYSGTEAICVARHLANGTLDPAFGAGGFVTVQAGAAITYAGKAQLDASGRILVPSNCFAYTAVCVTRFTASGALDATWGTNGTVALTIGGGLISYAPPQLLSEAGGGATIAFTCTEESGVTPYDDFCAIRLLPSGARDNTFGTASFVRVAQTFKVQSTPFPLLADGTGYLLASTCQGQACVVRLAANGAKDTTYGGLATGFARFQIAGMPPGIAAMERINGKVVVAGTCGLNLCAARLNDDGSLDVSFNGNGQVVVPQGGAYAIAADGLGMILGGGCYTTIPPNFFSPCLVRLNADGSLDTTFNDTGRFVTSLGTEPNVHVSSIVREAGRVIVAAQCQGPLSPDFCLAAYQLLDNDVPRAPTNVVATAGDAQVSVAFTPPTDNGGHAITSYTATCGTAIVSGAASPIVVAPLVNGVAVSCTVAATNSVGAGPLSTPSASVTPRKVTATALTVNVNPSTAGANTIFTATVDGEAPTGTVQFFLDGTPIGICGTPLSNGVAVCQVNNLAIGAHTVVANYLGDPANTPSTSNTIMQNVVAGGVQLSIGFQIPPAGDVRVVSSPAGIDCGASCVGTFALNSTVTLTFTPASGVRVTAVVNCTQVSPNTCTVVMTANKQVAFTRELIPEGDADGDGIPTNVEQSQGTDPLVKDNNLFATTPAGTRLFVMQQYRDFLGREGENAGVQFYVDGINAGTYTRAGVIENFFNSPEFGGTVAPVARLYFATFLRAPDYDGLLFQVNALRAGAPLAVIANNFTLSPEFQARYGALSDAQYIVLLYQNILGRTPVQAEIDFHVNRLAIGLTRGEVLVGFSESPEYQAAIFNEVYTTMMYVGMLRRVAEPAGFAFWVSYMDAGNPGIALILGFLQAQEYHDRFLP